MAHKNYNGTLAERFERYSIPEPNSGCLIWIGCLNNKGYGRAYNDKMILATHAALLLAGTPVPEGFCALHKCDMPVCVNVDHLFIGTRADNNADKFAKGRHCREYTKKTHCKRGHELAGENLLLVKSCDRPVPKRM